MTDVLYILMRNDMDSMNCGKAIAQGSHASNAFVKHMEGFIQEWNFKPVRTDQIMANINGFANWEKETPQGFGTVLVLEAKYNDIKNTIDIMDKLGYVSGIVFDPTYPILDGEVVHHIPLDTCGYVFVPQKETDFVSGSLLGKFQLHK
jgi:peptidyl-tRNA hydrolase